MQCPRPYRWAGDESVILLPESDPELVEKTVARARSRRSKTFGSRGRAEKGCRWAPAPDVAAYPDGAALEVLMRTADMRIHKNKSEHSAAACQAVS